jgi:Xaa-Pro aminopeptidase
MSGALLLVGDSQSNANLYYRTHFLAGDPFAYAEAGGRAVLVVSSMERGRAEKESIVPEVRAFGDFGNKRLDSTVLRGLLAEIGTNEVAVEAVFPVGYADDLRAAGIAVTVDHELLVAERRHKTAEEIAAITAAQRVTERAMGRAIELIASSKSLNGALHIGGIPLTSERLRGEIEMLFLREGMDFSLAPIVAGGPGAADPHWLGAGPLRECEAIVIDLFPRSRKTRYFADMTRTVVKGQPPALLADMYEATSRALDAALGAIRPGADGKDVHEAADTVFREAGFHPDGRGPLYIHSTGHGVGLDIHEGPGLSSRSVELRPGDVITVEPGLYDPTVGGVRIEELVVVTEDGSTNLTRFPREFVV